MANIEQAQQMFPLITCEISLGQNVSKLVFGVDVFDLDFWDPDQSAREPRSSAGVRRVLIHDLMEVEGVKQ